MKHKHWFFITIGTGTTGSHGEERKNKKIKAMKHDHEDWNEMDLIFHSALSLFLALYRLRVREWPESVVVLLSCCVPQPQVHWLPIYHHICRIIIKPSEREREFGCLYVTGQWTNTSTEHSEVEKWKETRWCSRWLLDFSRGVCNVTHTVGMYSPGKALVV